MIVSKSSQMLEIDKKTIEDYKIPGIVLMEHAAMAIAQEVPDTMSRGVVLCGTGNNGGDGFAVARVLSLRGHHIEVIIVGDYNNLKQDAKVMYEMLETLEIQVTWCYDETYEQCQEKLTNAEYIIDAIFGIACSRAIKGHYHKLITMANAVDVFTVSVDIPSGINSDNGKIMSVHMNADVTVTFTLPKVGNLLYPGALATKQLKVVDIGVPQMVLEQFEFAYETLDEETLQYMPKRHPVSHKMSYGKLLVIAGSKGMSGAASMAVRSAYRTGAGLVQVVTHESCKNALQTTVPEAIVTTYTDDFESLQTVMDDLALHIDHYSAILIGPGLSISEASSRWLEFALSQPTLPVVVDADGLNVLAKNLEMLEEVTVPVALTPHIGEMARLTGYPSSAILENTVAFAQAFSKSHNVVVALKSGRTVVTSTDGACCINTCGNDGMATAGSGDVLAGVVVSLLGQGLDVFKGTCVGVALHSIAGDVAAKKMSHYGLMASDIIESIPEVLRTL